MKHPLYNMERINTNLRRRASHTYLYTCNDILLYIGKSEFPEIALAEQKGDISLILAPPT